MTALLGKFSENEQQSPEVQSQRIHQEQVHQAFTNIKRLIGEIDASRHRDPLRGESTESKAVPLSSERGDESYERRPYSPGDSMRNMDWKAWARTDRYIVKEQDPVRSRPIALTIDVISLVHDGQAQRELAETLFALRRHHASIAGIDLILSPTQGRRIDVNRNGFGRKSARGQDTLAILHGLEKMITELVQQHEQSSVASVAEINYGIYPENQAALWQSYQAGLHRLVLSVLQARESNWSQEDIDQLLLMKLQATAQKKNSVAVIGFGNSKEALIEKLGQKRAWR